MERLSRWQQQVVTAPVDSPWFWLQRLVLMPLSCLYGAVGLLREALYRYGILRVWRAPVPVISVGNLAVGGTGKTPMVDYLVRFFLSSGLRVAVVSRGYGRKGEQRTFRVRPEMDAELSGDEPLLLQRRNPQAAVFVAARRKAGILAAIADARAEIVILDDGFQHLQVDRDLNLLLLDARNPFDNGLPLPAGRLREFPLARRRADAVILTRAEESGAGPTWMPGAFRCRHRLADSFFDLAGHPIELEQLRSASVAAFAGLANAEQFFSALRQLGIEPVATLSLGDHADYRSEQLSQVNALTLDAEFLLTTEKDGVKLKPTKLQRPCFTVAVELDFGSAEAELEKMLTPFSTTGAAMNLNQELLEILACPQCKGPLEIDQDASELLCPSCRLAYPVRDDIPVMLLDEARRY